MKKKFGLISMVVVLTLGALGIGYAAYTDTLTITGTRVNTGNVDIDMLHFSGTWLVKTVDHGSVFVHGWNAEKPTNGTIISYAQVTSRTPDPDGWGYDKAVVTYSNLCPAPLAEFPTNGAAGEWIVDFHIHYPGRVPAHLMASAVPGGADAAWLAAKWEAGEAGFRVYHSNLAGDKGTLVEDMDIQLHQGDDYLVELFINITQDGDVQADAGKNGTFTVTVTAVQWNELPYP